MRRLVLVILLVLLAAFAYRSFGNAETGTGTLTLAQPAPNKGQSAPNFIATGIDGETFRLKDKGTYVLTYWSTLNKGSAESRPDFSQKAKKYGDKGVTFAVVYVNGAPKEDENAPYVVIQDSAGRLASLYNIKRVPRLFVIQDGRITLAQNPTFEGAENDFSTALREATEKKREN